MERREKPRSYFSLTGRAVLAVLQSPYTITRRLFNKRKSKLPKRNYGNPIQAKNSPPPLPIERDPSLGLPLDVSLDVNDTLGQANEPQKRCGFHSMPIELKRMIYLEFIYEEEIVVSLDNGILWSRRQETLPTDGIKNTRGDDILSLLLSCRQIYLEVVHLVYEIPTFTFQNIPAFLAFYTAVPPALSNVIQAVHVDLDSKMVSAPPSISLSKPTHSRVSLRDPFRYDLVSGKWKTNNSLPRSRFFHRPTWWQMTGRVLHRLPALKKLTVEAPIKMFSKPSGEWNGELMGPLDALRHRVDFVITLLTHHFKWDVESDYEPDYNGGSVWTWSAKEGNMSYRTLPLKTLYWSDY